MRRHFTCVAINLDHRPVRWRMVRRVARLHGLSAQRFAAHDGGAGRERWPESSLTNGELGLWSSFVDVMGMDCADEFMIVLEDDAVLLPGFVRHARRLADRMPPAVSLVQLGWLGDSAWRPRLSVAGNVRKLLRPRSRVRRLRRRLDERRAGATPAHRAPLQPALLAGTHALLVRTADRRQLLEWLGTPSLALDRRMIVLADAHPGALMRSRRNLAWQLPFRSDIAPRRQRG